MKNNILPALSFFFLLLSCNQVEVFDEPSAYATYTRKLNLSLSATNHTLQYKVSLVPTEMLGLQNGVPVDSVEAWYSNNIELVMEITDTGTGRDLLDLFPSNSSEYGRILSYYSVGILDNLTLVAGADTIRPIYANPVRTYGVLKNNPVVLGFSLDQPLRNYKKLQVRYYDALFYNENLEFDLSDTDYRKTPKLNKKV